MTPFYLLAHIQRRHQGLPLPLTLQQVQNSPSSVFPLQLQQTQSSGTAISTKVLEPTIGSGIKGLGGSPTTIYAFTMSPNGTVTDNQNLAETNVNLNNNIIPACSSAENSSLLAKRRDSETQTGNAVEHSVNSNVNTKSKSEGELRNDENGEKGSDSTATFAPNSKSNSDLAPLLKVIKSPGHNRNTNDSDTERENFQNQNNKDATAAANLIQASGLDLNTICDLVQKYLEQKSVASQNQHYDKILKSIYNSKDQIWEQNNGNNVIQSRDQQQQQQQQEENQDLRVLGVHTPTSWIPLTSWSSASGSSGSPSRPPPLTRVTLNDNNACDNISPLGNSRGMMKDTERIERNVMRMKDEFETQWAHLSEKVRDSGVEELKEAFLTEIKVRFLFSYLF